MFKRVSASITGMALALALGVACAGAQQPAPAGPAGPGAAAPEGPVQPKVNRLVFSLDFGTGVETVAPRHGSQPGAWRLEPMFEYLIGVDAQTGKLAPELATEWNLEPDGRSFRFKLRKGVQFHKGAGEFTAKDVVYTHQDFIRPDSTHGETPYWRDVVKEVQVVNDYEVVFHLTRPDGNFLNATGRLEGDMMAIQSKASFDAKGEPTLQAGPTAGTGPYQFKELVQGSQITYERVPYKHWKVTPDFPEFQFRFIKEASTRLAALLTGEVHVASLPQDLLKSAEGQGFKAIRGRVPGFRAFVSMYCCFPADRQDLSKGMYVPPGGPSSLMDVRVRKALNKAINRDDLNKAFFGGKGERMVVNHMHPTRPGWNPDWERRYSEAYGYDPAKARALLAEAGYGPNNPLTPNLLLNPAAGVSGTEDIMEAIGGFWRAVGVNVNFETIDLAQLQVGRRERKYTNQIALTGTSAAPIIGLVWNSTSGGRNPNYPGAMSLELEGVVRQIYDTVDTKKQEELFRTAGELVFEQYLSIPLFWLPSEAVVSPKFVADYVFPGSISGTWSHVFNIKAAR